MKIKLFFCIIFLHTLLVESIYSQGYDSASGDERDSISRLIDRLREEDEEKVRLMNEYARLCFFKNDFYNGLIATYSARQLSEKLNYQEGKLMYYLTLASFHINADMRTFYRKKAQWQSSLFDQQMDKYNTYVDIPGYSMGNDLEEISNHFIKALRHFEELDDSEIQANILVRLMDIKIRLDKTEELKELIKSAKKLFSEADEVYPVLLLSLFELNELINSDKAEEARRLEYEIIELITKNENEVTIGLIANTMATNYRERGRWAIAIEYYLQSMEVFEEYNDLESLFQTQYQLGVCYENLGLNSRAADSYKRCIATIQKRQDTTMLYHAYGTLVFPLIALGEYDEAKKYMDLMLHDTITENRLFVLARYNDAKGQIIRNQGKYAEAIPYFEEAFRYFTQYGFSSWAPPFMKLYLAECYLQIDNYNDALKEGLQCLEMENALSSENTLIKNKISLLLSETFDKKGDLDMAFKYLKMHQEIRAEADQRDEANRIADAEVRAILEKSQKEIDTLENLRLQNEQERKMQKLWLFSIAGGFFSALLLTIILYRNNKSKQKANIVLREQKVEIETTLNKLKATQAQLIQSEKMASLGELTAGIAHEIQNPLNFVNNFSEVSEEMIDEVNEEIENGEIGEAKHILKNLKGNLGKISHHGKIASGIVKNMLDHSQAGTGDKMETDINALCNEYLRLAYHGMRSKNRNFNAEFNTDLDPHLPKMKIVPKDIGRVLLNLINNAFQAILADKGQRTVDSGKVIVSTKNLGDRIEISIADNGSGIPETVKEKIFQPFFTTRPAGQGTGLGLSLSYDIVKAYGGELRVETKEAEGSKFVVELPIE